MKLISTQTGNSIDATGKFLQSARVAVVAAALASTLLLAGCAGDFGLPSTDPLEHSKSKLQQQLIEFGRVSDSFGSYTRTYIDATAIPFKNDTDREFSDAELQPVLDTAVKFVSLEALDSIALDNASQWDTWKKTVAPQYISRNHINEVLNRVPDTGGKTSNIILQNTDKLVPVLLRDGGVRIADKRISSVIFKPKLAGSVSIEVSGTAIVYTDDKNGASWSKTDMRMQNPDGSLMTESQLKQAGIEPGLADSPVYADGKPNSALLGFTVYFQYVKEDGKWMISDFSNSFGISTFDLGDAGQLGFRNRIASPK